MPIYEYRCKRCQQDSEILQAIHDAPLIHCNGCGQDTLERLVSAAGFRLKGGGWYETDFKTAAEKQKNLVNAREESAKGSAVPTTPSSPPPASSSADN
jgi:putative FmdB family regulatory protein